MASLQGIRTLVDLFERSTRVYAARPFLGAKTGTRWVYGSYASLGRQVGLLRTGLASAGIGPGDRVGIIANNRPEWVVAAYATYGRGAAFVPMYEQQPDREWEFVLRDSGCKAVFAADRSVCERVAAFRSRTPALAEIIAFSGDPGGGYAALVEQGARSQVPPCAVEPGDLATLLYTSGTTGSPKGVMLSHANVVSNLRAVQDVLPVDERDRSLAFLPWAHAFGHTAELHLMLSIGASIAVCDGTDKILANLAEVRPSILFAVPRVFNRLFASVELQMASKPRIVQRLFRHGVALSLARLRGEHLGALDQAVLILSDALLFSKVRGRFGGRLRHAVSGAAALSKEVAEFVDALGITVYEGYGLTETSPIVAVNVPGRRRMGSVGQPIEGVRVDIVPTAQSADGASGEIVVHGPNVMVGYHGRPDETHEVLSAEGGLRTGDMGYLDADGYLYVTGRIKEQYKLENGKFVDPSSLEEALKLSPYVANVLVYGENRPFNVAIVVPQLAALRTWAARSGIDGDTDALLSDPRVERKLRREIDRHSQEFKAYERIRKFRIVSEDFTLENDMLTPSLKIKRRNALRAWRADIDRLYEEP